MQQSQPLISVLHRLQSDSVWLNSICATLNVEGAGIQTHEGRWQLRIGSQPPETDFAPLRGEDGAVDILPSGTSLICVPMFSAYESPPRWCIFWTNTALSLTTLYATLAKATAMLARNALAHHRQAADHHAELIERAAATANIGVWGCTLPEESLSWSDGVYDIFELPRRSIVDRDQILRLYTPESAAELEQRRSQAIATLSGFSMDADIITAKGNKRVMRITAAVDQVDGTATQIYGVKQDITAEHALVERTRILAETDPLTGIANRSRFQHCLDDLHGTHTGRAVGALFLIDLDNFKAINDTYGHLAGDACLIETARRLEACVPESALVARLGGDEFAIVTDASAPCDGKLASAILKAFTEPMVLNGVPRQIGISIGIADCEPDLVADTLYHNADLALYQAKQGGRGTWRLYRAA